MFYFDNFPTVAYNPPMTRPGGVGDAKMGTASVLATDISKRFIIKQIVGDPNLVYYDYLIQDGERPDVIAEKYYDDGRLDWILLMFNLIMDPYYEWPLSNYDFNQTIRQKFGSVSAAQALVHRYEQLVYPESKFTDVDGQLVAVPARYVTVDESKYLSLVPTERRLIDKFTHESNLNEDHRKLKILDADFITELLRNYRNLMET